MRARSSLPIVLVLSASACVGDGPTASAPSASPAALSVSLPPSYEIRDLQGDLALAGFDGAFSIAFDISDAGRVAGAATVPGGYQHGFRWAAGRATDVGTLGGAELNSQAGGRAGRSELSILSEVDQVDPLEEDFCGFHSPLACRPALWRDGVMTPLDGLPGGTNAAALSMNSQGQIVGLADDGVLDNSCVLPQKSHFQAVSWERGRIHVLPPLAGDEVAMAVRNNERGLVVGTSGDCSNTLFNGTGMGAHAVLWDHGTPVDLGDLGDPISGFAAAVNNQGEVFGAAGTADGALHAFRWTRQTGIQDLGLMSSDPTDRVNTPFQANDSGQMVGASCDVAFGFCRGYLWQAGSYTDLNELIPEDAPLYVILPLAINQAGQIAGLAVVKSTGEVHAFLATPAPGGSGIRATHGAAATRRRLPASVRGLLGRRAWLLR